MCTCALAQIEALPGGEREQVLSIRHAAVQKMKLAHALHGTAYGTSQGVPGSSCVGIANETARFPAPARAVGFATSVPHGAAAVMPPPKLAPRSCFSRSDRASDADRSTSPLMGPPRHAPCQQSTHASSLSSEQRKEVHPPPPLPPPLQTQQRPDEVDEEVPRRPAVT